MRQSGYYWVKDNGEWEIAKWYEYMANKFEWYYFDRMYKDDDFEEIDERKILPPIENIEHQPSNKG